MDYGGASLDPEVREGLARTYKPLRAIGIVAIVIGCFAILLPELFSLGAAVFVQQAGELRERAFAADMTDDLLQHVGREPGGRGRGFDRIAGLRVRLAERGNRPFGLLGRDVDRRRDLLEWRATLKNTYLSLS